MKINLESLLKMLDGKKEITVYTASKEQKWVNPQQISRVVVSYGGGEPTYDDVGVPNYVPGLWSNKGWSLRDAGIVDNTYNSHQTFATEAEAREYAGLPQYCSECGRPLEN